MAEYGVLLDEEQNSESKSWAWGEFPTSSSQISSPITESAGRAAKDEEADHHSKLSNIFSFMKHQRHNSNDGIYLADLSSGAIDPKVAALYFTGSNRTDRGK